MKISWPDGLLGDFSASFLRRHCRCAACQHELTGERLLDPASVPDNLTVEKAEILGRYALGFSFSDGHSTGIYTFDWLRSLAEASRQGAS
jgi:ATP-binding protein involved in chromosome partitioning